MRPRRLLAWALAALAAWLTSGAITTAHAQRLSASLGSEEITFGGTTYLEIVYSGSPKSSAPKLPPIPGLAVSSRPSIGRGFTSVGGAVEMKVTYRVQVQPRRVGEIQIPSIQWDGLQTEPLTLNVVRPTFDLERIQRRPINTAGNRAFLDLIPEKTSVYVGEPFEVTVQIATILDHVGEIRNLQISPEGFTMKPVQGDQFQPRDEPGPNFTLRLYSNTTTARAVKTGSLPFGPAQVDVDVAAPRQRQRSPGSGMLLDLDAFFGGRYQTVTIAAETPSIEVKPLPTEDRPESFSGAIGAFTMAYEVSPTEVNVGDPVTVTVRIVGEGALDSVRLPKDLQWRDFKLYDPVSEIVYTNTEKTEGVATFEIVATPLSVEADEVPEMRFAYFDPDAGTYQEITKPAVAIQVRPGSGRSARDSVPDAFAETGASPGASEEWRHILPRPAFVARLPQPMARNPLYWTIVLAPMLTYIGLIGSRKIRAILGDRAPVDRNQAVEAILEEGLQSLETYASVGDHNAFFETMSRLLRELIGARLGLSSDSLTPATAREEVSRYYDHPEAIQTMESLFSLCDEARFGVVNTDRSLHELISQFRGIRSALTPVKSQS